MSENQKVISAAELKLRSRPMTEIVIISAGESVSTAVDKSHHSHLAIFLPSTWTTAAITFMGSETFTGTYVQVLSATDASEVAIPAVAASKVIVLDTEFLEALIAIPFLKLRSGTLLDPVNQVSEASINIVLRR